MRNRFRLLGYLAAFWIIFQIVIRASFLLYNHTYSTQLTWKELLLVFVHGSKMDLSITGYFLMMSGMILSISVFTASRWIYRAINILSITILILSSVIAVVDMELYRHWGFRLNTTPLFYVGSEAMGSVDTRVIINLVIIFLLLVAGGLFVYLRFIAPRILKLEQTSRKAFLPLIITSALMFIPIRGSFTVAPMNTGFVFFHKSKSFANHAAINVVWNFTYSLRKSSNITYPENFYDKKTAGNTFDSLYQQNGPTAKIFKEQKPNIILFILESFTADIIEPLGGWKDVAPNLNKLCHEGVLFDNFYASGDRTDKGIISVLSGYPAQPQTSIIKYPSKTQKLPYLTHQLQRLGYRTSFTYGGDIDFANFRSYLTTCNFDYITTEDDFDDDINYSKWGVHDHFVLDRAFNECDSARAPFFKAILTLSSHEPFDVPMTSKFLNNTSDEALFLNSCHYTDSTLGVFVERARQKSWWQNTVIIFVADHGHRHPGNKQIQDKERFKIPLLMIGGAIKKDTIIHTIASQTDIANTLLAQIDTASSAFRFSKNILANDVKGFAPYFYNNGYGFLRPTKYIIYDNIGKQFLRTDNATLQDLNASKAYQQILYSDYNSK